MTEERFNLHRVVRGVLARGEAGADPAIVAKAVFREIPPRMYGEALAQALRTLVADAMRRARMDTSIVEENGQGVAEVTDVRAPERGGRRKPGRGYNRDGVREHWRRAITVSEYVNGERKSLGECTVADLQWLRDDRYALAAQNTAKGDKYGYIAELLLGYGVATIADLPEPVLAATFQPRTWDANGDAA